MANCIDYAERIKNFQRFLQRIKFGRCFISQSLMMITKLYVIIFVDKAKWDRISYKHSKCDMSAIDR